jgi:hypothetical protein
MTEENGHSLTTTHDCKTPGCVRESRSSVGRHAYCKPCQEQRAKVAPTTTGATLVEKLEGMKSLARQADAAEAKAKKLTRQALDAKAKADALRQQVAAAMREIAGTS